MKPKSHRIVYEEMKMVYGIKRELLLIVDYACKNPPFDHIMHPVVIKKYKRKPTKEQIKWDIATVKNMLPALPLISSLMMGHFPKDIPCEQIHLRKRTNKPVKKRTTNENQDT